jgi:hypothetical protein
MTNRRGRHRPTHLAAASHRRRLGWTYTCLDHGGLGFYHYLSRHAVQATGLRHFASDMGLHRRQRTHRAGRSTFRAGPRRATTSRTRWAVAARATSPGRRTTTRRSGSSSSASPLTALPRRTRCLSSARMRATTGWRQRRPSHSADPGRMRWRDDQRQHHDSGCAVHLHREHLRRARRQHHRTPRAGGDQHHALQSRTPRRSST